jgi:hypothetical protein
MHARQAEPAFYHSLSSDCTTNMVELLWAGRSDVLPAWHWSYRSGGPERYSQEVRRAGSHHESDQGWSKGPIQTQARSALPRFI